MNLTAFGERYERVTRNLSGYRNPATGTLIPAELVAGSNAPVPPDYCTDTVFVGELHLG